MKNNLLTILFIFSILFAQAQVLKPYTIGVKSNEKGDILKTKVITALTNNQLKLVGEYQAKHSADTWILVISSDELINSVETIGGLTGFAATLRVAITPENGTNLVSYTTPAYWGNAYYRDTYKKVAANYNAVEDKIEKAMAEVGQFNGAVFGSKKGLSEKDLREYHYMFGMPYFDDTDELAEFDTFKEAITKIDNSVKKGIVGVEQVYKIVIPNKKLAVYGFGLVAEDGEKKFMPIIDIDSPKHTAFLPYEILVVDNEVHMLHGRYRIALSFPDLTMGTFSKIMSTPGYIKDAFVQLVEE